jgi:Phage conserved hypothetical protein BR0599
MRIPSYPSDEAGTIINNSFDTLPLIANSGLTPINGWTRNTTDYFQTVPSAGVLTPKKGSSFLLGGDDNSGVSQTYAISQSISVNSVIQNATTANISAGWYLTRAKVWIARLDANSVGKITLNCLNASSTVLSTVTTSSSLLFTLNDWELVEIVAKIPVGTVKVQVILEAQSPTGSSNAQVAFDDVSIHFLCMAQENSSDIELAKLSYKTPSLNYINGTYGVDGDLLIQTRPITFGYSSVTGTSDKRGFIATGMAGSSANFYSGRLVWLSGKNAGRSSYIRTFDNTLKTVRLYQELPYAPEIGDYFIHSQGCDKTITRCGGGFGNASNFRGEPYLPGASKVLQFFT